MMSYILLLVIVLLVLIGILRASRQERKKQRPQREPNLGIAAKTSADEQLGPEQSITSEDFSSGDYGEDEIKSPPTVTTPAVAKNSIPGLENSAEATAPDTDTEVELQAPEVEQELIDFIVIHLFTDGERHYRGYELLQALLTSGLRYGKKGIFHRHEDLTGKGPILFSLAQAIEPGTFDLPKMGSFTTPGLIFFMMSSQLQNPLHAFDLMLNTVKSLQRELGGSLYDEKRQSLTSIKIEQLRSNLKIFSRDD